MILILNVDNYFNINLLNHDTHTDTGNYFLTLTSNGYLPLITRPTRIENRINSNHSATLIDHISTNTKYNCSPGIIKNDVTDHFSPFLVINLPTRFKKPKTEFIQKRVLNENNTNKLCDLLENKNQDNIRHEFNPELAYTNFFELYNNEYNNACPLENKRVLVDKLESNPWINDTMLEAKKRI